jgi:hypothetical protein
MILGGKKPHPKDGIQARGQQLAKLPIAML